MTPINKKRKVDFEQSEFEHAPLPRHYNLKIEKSNLYQRRKINKNAQKIKGQLSHPERVDVLKHLIPIWTKVVHKVKNALRVHC